MDDATPAKQRSRSLSEPPAGASPEELLACAAHRSLVETARSSATVKGIVVQTFQQFRQRTFSSLGIRNYRLYFVGQGISLCGTWMQTVAQALLVLKLTGSGTQLGLITAVQSIPILVLGPYGGVIADRFPKRQILYVTQAICGLLGLSVFSLVATNLIQLWMVFLAGALLGLVKVVDNPTRQAFVMEMVGPEALTNAISLNSTEVNLARVIGPTIAGALVATVGLAACFLLDGLSYAAVVISLAMMSARDLKLSQRPNRERGQVVQGLRYVREAPLLLTTLVMMAIIGLFTYEFSVSLPILAEFTFHSGASGFAALTAAMGFGSVVGGLYTASRKNTTPRMLVISAFLFGLSVLMAAFSPTIAVAFAAMVVVGFFSINFTSLGNATLQLHSTPAMRGRVMALWFVAFLGTTPFGGPLIGWISEHAGARWGLFLGGVAAILAAGIGARFFQLQREKSVAQVSVRTQTN
jgi:MFS family permease